MKEAALEVALFVGIDVSQDRLDLAVRPTGETRRWSTTQRGRVQ